MRKKNDRVSKLDKEMDEDFPIDLILNETNDGTIIFNDPCSIDQVLNQYHIMNHRSNGT